MVTCQGSTRCWNYLEVYWPGAGVVLAVNAIGTQLRDPINSGLTRWCTVCIVTHIARVWINRVRLPMLRVVSSTGKMNISLFTFAPENLVSRDSFGIPVPRQPAHLHTQAEYGAYLRDSSRVPRRRPFIYFKPPFAIGSVPSLSGHAIAYRWRSLPRVRRHRASKPQGSSEGVLPWQVAMDQLICASLSHTHYWYKVGMLKVPASMAVKIKKWTPPRKSGGIP